MNDATFPVTSESHAAIRGLRKLTHVDDLIQAWAENLHGLRAVICMTYSSHRTSLMVSDQFSNSQRRQSYVTIPVLSVASSVCYLPLRRN